MGLQKIRADRNERQPNGSVAAWAEWIGGPSLALVRNCPWESLQGNVRVTAYAQGEPDTYFSIPAKCRYAGKIVTGYITGGDDGLVFRHCYY